MLNRSIIMGRLTRDPELRRTGSGIAVTSFTVAVERDIPDKTTGEKKADFINCVAWRNTAEFIARYFAKGSMIVVDGRLQTREWTDNQTKSKRTALELIADSCYFGENKRQNTAPQANPGNNYSAVPANAYAVPGTGNSYAAPSGHASGFELLADEDAQLPF